MVENYLDYAPPPSPRSTWRFDHLGLALLVVFIIQGLLFSSLSYDGEQETKFSYAFDLLVLLRMWLAYHRHEQNRDWLFYTTLTYTSPLWMWLIFIFILAINR